MIPADLLDRLDAAKPNYLDRKSFLCLLLEQQLDTPRTLGGPSAAGTPSYSSITSTLLSNTSTKNIVVKSVQEPVAEEPVEAAATAAEPAPKRKKRKSRAEGCPAFEAFWKQYLAIKHRANGQTKPAALEAWHQITKRVTPERLQAALTAAVNQQVQQERETNWAAPFPDCHRWLSKGYWEQFIDAQTPPEAPVTRPDFTPPTDYPDAPF